MSFRTAAATLIAIAGLFACGPSSKSNGGDGGAGDDGGPVRPHDLTAISITPLNPIVELDLNTPGVQGFEALGSYADGTTEDVTSQVTWSVMNPAVGAFNGPTLSIPAFTSTTSIVSRVNATLAGLTGEAQITVVAYRKSGAQQDFFFVLPYQDTAGDQKKPLAFSTAIPALDVFFLMDTTGSMGGEIANLSSGLTNTIIPGIQNAVANTQFGVGAYMDFPISPYGSNPASADCFGARNAPDQPFELKTAITNVTSSIQAGVAALSNNGYPIGCGNDWHEGLIEGVYQAASGNGLSGPGATSVAANHTGIGGVQFRAGTMPVIVAMGDAASHAPGESTNCFPTSGGSLNNAYGSEVTTAHTRAATKTALSNICARVVGIASLQSGVGTCSAQSDYEDFARSTGARVPPAAWDVGTRPNGCAANQCCTDVNGAGRAPDADGLCPVVFRNSGDGTGIGANIVTGIQMLTRFATFDVTSEREGVTTDVDGNALTAPHTTADFIRAVTPVSFVKPPAPPVLPDPTFDTTAFHDVTPQTQVSFDVTAFNDFVQPTDTAQIFRATIRVLASGCTPLDERQVLILVPPTPIQIQ